MMNNYNEITLLIPGVATKINPQILSSRGRNMTQTYIIIDPKNFDKIQ